MVIGQPRSTQRYGVNVKDGEEALRAEIVRLATGYGRYGYRRITALLQRAGGRIISVLSGSGVRRGLRFQSDNPNGGGYG
jgi:hypothetical protein